MQNQIVNEMELSVGMTIPGKPVRKLKPKDEAAITLKFQGKSYPEIGKVLGATPGTVATWFCRNGKLHDAYNQRCKELLAPKVNPLVTHDAAMSVADRIKSAAPDALSTIIGLAKDAKREQVRFQSAADIMDRAGYAPVQKNLNVDMVGEMTMQELDALVLGIVSETEAKPIAQRHNVVDVEGIAEELMGNVDNVGDDDSIVDSLF